MNNIDKAAKMLRDAAETKISTSPIRELIGDSDLEAAYKIQELNTAERIRNGAHLVGRKIGLTSFAVQKQLGVDQPDYGMLFSDMEIIEGGTIAWDQCMQPKAEAEIAFVLNQNIDNENISIAQLISAIDYAVPCIEIVGSRVKDWNIKITDTIADNASASHFVIGHTPKKLFDINVVKTEMSLYKNGTLESTGNGKACMGSPINATWWLAKVMAKLGRGLQSGDLVLAGALGPMVAANPGDAFEADFGALGSVSVQFGKENN
ncbi:MAG: 2-keto-4-pentenoate hydratase [Bacteroidia bacterium]